LPSEFGLAINGPYF